MGLTKKYIKSKKTCKVTFSIPERLALGSDYVSILGDFNNWDYSNAEMERLKDGSFQKTLELAPGKTYEYRYMTKDGHWFNDEAADAYTFTQYAGTDNSVVDLTGVEITTPAKKVTPAKKAKPATKKTPVAKKATTKAPAAKKAVKSSAKVVTAKKSTPAVKSTTAVKSVKANKKVAVKAAKKVAKNVKDNLQKIEGVGPKIASILAENGFSTFENLSKATVAKLETVLKTAGPRFTMHKPASWPKQAKLAAKGQWDELKKLQDSLNAGK